MEFSERLRLLRLQAQMTQEELAAKLFVTRQAVSNYEQGIRYPSLDTLVRIAQLFGVSLDELLPKTQVCRVPHRARYLARGLLLCRRRVRLCRGAAGGAGIADARHRTAAPALSLFVDRCFLRGISAA